MENLEQWEGVGGAHHATQPHRGDCWPPPTAPAAPREAGVDLMNYVTNPGSSTLDHAATDEHGSWGWGSPISKGANWGWGRLGRASLGLPWIGQESGSWGGPGQVEPQYPLTHQRDRAGGRGGWVRLLCQLAHTGAGLGSSQLRPLTSGKITPSCGPILEHLLQDWAMSFADPSYNNAFEVTAIFQFQGCLAPPILAALLCSHG